MEEKYIVLSRKMDGIEVIDKSGDYVSKMVNHRDSNKI